jgi:hypothetical protein
MISIPTIRRARISMTKPFLDDFFLLASTIPIAPRLCSCIQPEPIGFLRKGITGRLFAVELPTLIVRVVVALPVPGVTVAGEKLHVALEGKPLQLNFMALENDPPTAEAVNR